MSDIYKKNDYSRTDKWGNSLPPKKPVIVEERKTYKPPPNNPFKEFFENCKFEDVEIKK